MVFLSSRQCQHCSKTLVLAFEDIDSTVSEYSEWLLFTTLFLNIASSHSFQRRMMRSIRHRRCIRALCLLAAAVLPALYLRGRNNLTLIANDSTRWRVETKVACFVQVVSADSLFLVEEQLKNLKRFLVADFRYNIVTPEPLDFKEFAEREQVAVHKCPMASLAGCMDHVFRSLLVREVLDGAQLLLHLNIDMFLLRRWNIQQYFTMMDQPGIIAVIEDHTPAQPYLHPGLFMVNISKVPSIRQMSFQHENYLSESGDTGTATFDFMIDNPSIVVRPMIWSRHFDLDHLRANALLTEQVFRFVSDYMRIDNMSSSPVTGMAPDFYTHDFSWFHLRDSTCWSGSCLQRVDFIANSLPRFLDRLNPSVESTMWPQYSCLECATTVSGKAPHLDSSGAFVAKCDVYQPNQIRSSRQLRIVASTSEQTSLGEWMKNLYKEADKLEHLIQRRLPNGQLSLPLESAAPRKNLATPPPRYDEAAFKNDTSFYWKYVYNGSQDLPKSEVSLCEKGKTQRYWAITYADGAIRERIARLHTRPSCLLHGVDEFRIFGPADLDDEYRRRNAELLQHERGKGLWIWKHYVQYRTLYDMDEDDILLYIDSDFRCDESIRQYFCLAQHHDIVGFHHSHEWYTLSRLASRDSMILMNLDNASVAHSVQSSGGNILFRKTPKAVAFVRELGAWSQQAEVVGNHGQPSRYGEDWPEYVESGYNHQCDQAVSSLMFIKYGIKTFPWHLEGFGAGSNDELNRAQRAESGLTDKAMSIHVQSDLSVDWKSEPNPRDLVQLDCMAALERKIVDTTGDDGAQLLKGLDTYQDLCVPTEGLVTRRSHEVDDTSIRSDLIKHMRDSSMRVSADDDCVLFCVACRSLRKKSVNGCRLQAVSASKPSSKDFTWLYAEQNQTRRLRMDCSGKCASDVLRHLIQQDALPTFDTLQFQLKDVDLRTRCQLYAQLKKFHEPAFRFQESWERWVTRK